MTIAVEGLKSDGIVDAMRGNLDDGFPKHFWEVFKVIT